MMTRDCLITSSAANATRTMVWNLKKQLPLDYPVGWVLQAHGPGFRAIDLSNPNIEERLAQAITVDDLSKKTVLDLPHAHRNLMVTVQPLEPIPAPYVQQNLDREPFSNVPRQLMLFQGTRYFFSKYRPVGRKLNVKYNGQTVFTFEKTDRSFVIVPKKNHLKVKLDGKKTTLPKGVSLVLHEEILDAVFIFGINWWRFRSVLSPDALPPIEREESEEDFREAQRYRKTTQFVSGFLSILFVFSLIFESYFAKKTKIEVAQVEITKPKIIPHAPVIEVKPPPPPILEPIIQKAVEKVIKKKPIAKIEMPRKSEVQRPRPKKREVVTKPLPPPPVRATAPPKPGVIANKNNVPTAPPDPNAALLKSLSFLSPTGKKPKAANLDQYSESARKDFTQAPALGGGKKDSKVLDNLSTQSTNTDIATKSSRLVASDSGISSNKGLNSVQGRVSSRDLYSPGGKVGGSLSGGSGIALSGPGQISEGAIEKALSKYLQRFQFCYEKALLTDPSLSGDLRMQWTITGSGRVTDPKVVSSQMPSASLQSCVISVLKEVPFPSPKGGSVTAKKTFNFKSSVL